MLRTLGQSNIKITPIIMGCWQAGKAFWQDIHDEDSIKAIRAAYEAGINAFDTAPGYGEGHSERLVGRTLKDVRDKVVIATKVFSDHLRYEQVLTCCEESLKNLQTDYIDLYQIHWPSGSWGHPPVPIEETMRALIALKQQGKIRAIGVSNFSSTQIAEARQYGEIESVQPPYSLFWRQADDDLTPYCKEHNLTILAYSPLAQGLLSGRFTREHHFPAGEFRSHHKLCQPEHYERVQQALDRLRPIAAHHEITLSQLALAWLIARPQTMAIAGARTADQVVDNAKAMQVKLSLQDIENIEQIGRSVTKHLNQDAMMWTL
jgi:myo-inositol catabolism protein IolS